ncbi:MAG: twin-arginine translocase subunit TatC [Arcanobacterium sp.]|nr:twin-arginine translocase subunit TatC [Arcanobacterium sp.]
MGVLAHLRELRKRLIYVLIGLTGGAVAGWYLYDPVMAFIQRPLHELAGSHVNINFQTIGAAFDLKFTVALWISAIITSPWWIAQIGIFIAPALKRRERLFVITFGTAGVVLFLAGAASGVWVAPRAVEILQSFVPADAVSLLQANSYVSFYMRLVIAFGLSFLAPELLVALNFLGLLSARTMLKGWRWATVAAFIFAAVANPLPSPWPMILQALVLIGLYFGAVLIAWIREKLLTRRQRRAAPTSASTATPPPAAASSAPNFVHQSSNQRA